MERSTAPASSAVSAAPPPDRWSRVVIANVRPEIDGGRFPIKRTVGERVVVEADVFADGHDVLACRLLWRRAADPAWTETPMEPLVNDRWRASFTVDRPERHVYGVSARMDPFATWARDLQKRATASQDLAVDLLAGAALVHAAAARATGIDAAALTALAERLDSAEDQDDRVKVAFSSALAELMERSADWSDATRYECGLAVEVDRERARFSTWYEMFPRSCSPEPNRAGTLRDCEALLPYVREMGFDVLYLPPIHPIGRAFRKGRNNEPVARADDVGSPWAIGGPEGGHKSIDPALGTLDDFRSLVRAAESQGIEVALDYALQCSPDHPYVREHPDWFRARPDGTIQYAENPPKKYQDIYPLDFENPDWKSLWTELLSIVQFWIQQGVRIFRVDNPHTKPFAFWEWLISAVKRDHPETLFLSEAFTRPKVMYRLAKLGFTQSYTYFAWRNTAEELEKYFTELSQTEVREYFRPNLWPNTPDILTEYLQTGGRPAFMARLVLAATLGASYGIYGPPFELCQDRSRESGSEEYLNSEKYEVRHWKRDDPASLRHLIARVNRIRRENPALQSDHGLRFHPIGHNELLCYSKATDDNSNVVLVCVNLDPHHTHHGWTTLPLKDLGLPEHEPFQVHDLLTDARYIWHGPHNYIELDPRAVPAHVFRVRRKLKNEREFEYYL